MTVYLDLVFVLNLWINYLLLRGTARLGARGMRPRRLWLSAALGAVYAMCVYLPGMQWLQLPSMKLLTAVAMLCLAFGCSRATIRLGAIFALLTLVLCGAIYGIQALQGRPFVLGKHLFYPVSFTTLLLTAFAVCLACRLMLPRLTHAPDSVLPLTLELRGKRVQLSALRDSGNTLCDPLSGAPVLTVYWKAISSLLPERINGERLTAPTLLLPELREFSPRLIPYRAVGTSKGLLLALPCRITLGGITKTCLVALSPTPVSDGGAYEALTGGMLHV